MCTCKNIFGVLYNLKILKTNNIGLSPKLQVNNMLAYKAQTQVSKIKFKKKTNILYDKLSYINKKLSLPFSH